MVNQSKPEVLKTNQNTQEKVPVKKNTTAKKTVFRLPKWLVLALTAGLGCFAATLLLGEPFLVATHKAAPPVQSLPPQSVVLAIDVSGSMDDNNKLDEVKQAAINFVNHCDLSKDKIAIVTFDTSGRIAQHFSQDSGQLIATINSLSTGAMTNFEDAMINSESVLLSEPGEKTILLFTDGENTEGDADNAKTIANRLRSQGVKILAIGTSDADSSFLSSLTDDSKLVIGTHDGQFEEAFNKAEKIIFSKSLMESGGGRTTFVEALIRVSVWTVFLCFGIALSIKIMQSRFMREAQLLTVRHLAVLLVGSVIAGLAAGATGQILYSVFSSVSDSFANYAGRIIAWAILGAVLARGLVWFIPNLNKGWALKSGAIGGGLGAIGFCVFTEQIGDLGGRIIGAFILGFCIGLIVGVVEAICRDAWLRIDYGHNESTTINLGEQAVSVGSARRDSIHIRGAGESSLVYELKNGQIICSENGRSRVVNIGEKRTIGNVTIEICGKR